MAAHDYKCRDCDETVEVKFKVGEPSVAPSCPTVDGPHALDERDHEMVRVWGSVAGWVVW